MGSSMKETGGDLSIAERRRLAEAVRSACLQASLESYERAAMSGLCHEGAWECALDAVRALDLEPIIRRPGPA